MRKVDRFDRQREAACYSDGLVILYTVTDGAAPGHKPVQQLREKCRLHYAVRKLGIQRYYAAQQAQVQVERVIRIPSGVPVNTQMVAETEDGNRYSISMIQDVQGYNALDLTLARLTQTYEVMA